MLALTINLTERNTKMNKQFTLGKFYTFIEENCGDSFFTPPVKKTCTLEFENKKSKFSVVLNEDEMKQLVGVCVKAFGLKAVVSAASEVDEDDDE